jgi:hypothetical protein
MLSRRHLLIGIPAVAILPILPGCGVVRSRDDIARLMLEGAPDAARRATDTLLERQPDDPRLRMMAGALAFAAGDLGRAAELFAAAGEEVDLAENPPLATGLAGRHWRALTALRRGMPPLPDSPDLAESDPSTALQLASALFPDVQGMAALDPPAALITGGISVEAFVDAKVDAARRMADATVLSVTSSSGRDALLESLAQEHLAEYRCTGSFVAAERALASGDTAAARAGLVAALNAGAVNLLEHHAATIELARLG